MLELYRDELLQMRNEGKTYEEIAKEFGVTRQAVWGYLGQKRRNQSIYDNIPFQGLYEIFRDNPGLTINRFVLQALHKNDKTTQARYWNLLTRKEAAFKISEIKKILEHTGLTFEQLFAERTDNENQT